MTGNRLSCIYTTAKVKAIFTARKRSLGQGNMFIPVCHSVRREGLVPGGGGPRTATAVGGTHATGMHSYFL